MRLLILGSGLLAIVLPLAQAQLENGPRQSFETTSTEHIPFAPGGTIRVNNSFGYLTVEGWDSAEVEVTVTKSTDRFYEPSREPQAEQRFQEVRVETERRSDRELTIFTLLPAHKGLLHSMLVTRPLEANTRHGVTVDYKIHVPRNSHVVIHHDFGYVWVSDVTGNIEVNSHTGDMIVMLPDPGPYAIDARTRMGNITSDFVGKSCNRLLAGWNFGYSAQTSPRQIRLRMGRGCITLKNGLTSGSLRQD